MSKLKTTGIIVASAAAGIALWQWLQDEPHPVSPQISVVKEYVIAPPSAQAASTDMAFASPLGKPLAAPISAPAPNEFGAKLLAAKDIKAFVIDALKHPEKGGVFYAHEALRQCDSWMEAKHLTDESIQKIVATKSTISAEQLAMMKEQETRCSGLAWPDIDALEDEMYRVASSDPLVKASMAGRYREDIVATRNLALMSANETPFRMMSGLRSDSGTNFNGHLYGPDEEPALDAAIQLSTCAGGDYCRLEEQRLGRCWHQGKCYATQEDFVKNEILHGDQAAFDKAQVIAEQIRSAIARGDTSIFH